MALTDRPPGNARIAAALLDQLAVDGEAGARARVLRATGMDEVQLRSEAARLPAKRLAAALRVARVDRKRGRRIGRELVQPSVLGLLAATAGIGGLEKAYRRCEQLLAGDGDDGATRAEKITRDSAQVRFRPATDAPAPEPALCGVREGMLSSLAGLFGVPPATVRETACAGSGAPECVFEVRWAESRRGTLYIGAAAAALVTAGIGLALGWLPAIIGAAATVAGVLGGGTGLAFDLAARLAALARHRSHATSLIDQADSALAEKMDELAKVGSVLEGSAEPADAPEPLAAGEAPAARRTSRRHNADLAAMAEGAVESLRRGLDSRVEVTLDAPAEPVPLRCDAFQIEQMLHHLLRNGVQASEAAGGGAVKFALARTAAGVEITIEDSGEGIDPEIVDTVFDPFAPAPVAGVPGGFGLPVSVRIVEAHGGELRVESEPGKGTRVTVVLPDAAATAPRSA